MEFIKKLCNTGFASKSLAIPKEIMLKNKWAAGMIVNIVLKDKSIIVQQYRNKTSFGVLKKISKSNKIIIPKNYLKNGKYENFIRIINENEIMIIEEIK